MQCNGCGQMASYVEEHNRWYCYGCQEYLPEAGGYQGTVINDESRSQKFIIGIIAGLVMVMIGGYNFTIWGSAFHETDATRTACMAASIFIPLGIMILIYSAFAFRPRSV